MFNSIKEKIFGVRINNVNTFKKTIINSLNSISEPKRIKVTYVKNNNVVKQAIGRTKVPYRLVLENAMLSKNCTDAWKKFIKAHLDKNEGRHWGESNDAIVKYGNKRYVAILVEKVKVLYGQEAINNNKESESEKICNYINLHPRNIEVKHIAKINIDGKKFVNNTLFNKIK